MARTPFFKRRIVEQWAERLDEDIILYEGLDEALVGIAQQFTKHPVAVYDYGKIIKVLCRDMSYDDAVEHFIFNIEGAWVGEGTPVVLRTIKTLSREAK
jgi:hypothetical protein